MSHVTLAWLKKEAKRLDALLRLKAQAKRLGIKQDHIARAADVDRTLVVHVFAGRARSANVVKTAERLIAARRAQKGSAA